MRLRGRALSIIGRRPRRARSATRATHDSSPGVFRSARSPSTAISDCRRGARQRSSRRRRRCRCCRHVASQPASPSSSRSGCSGSGRRSSSCHAPRCETSRNIDSRFSPHGHSQSHPGLFYLCALFRCPQTAAASTAVATATRSVGASPANAVDGRIRKLAVKIYRLSLHVASFSFGDVIGRRSECECEWSRRRRRRQCNDKIVVHAVGRRRRRRTRLLKKRRGQTTLPHRHLHLFEKKTEVVAFSRAPLSSCSAGMQANVAIEYEARARHPASIYIIVRSMCVPFHVRSHR